MTEHTGARPAKCILGVHGIDLGREQADRPLFAHLGGLPCQHLTEPLTEACNRRQGDLPIPLLSWFSPIVRESRKAVGRIGRLAAEEGTSSPTAPTSPIALASLGAQPSRRTA